MKHRKIVSNARESFGDIAPAFVRYSEEVLFEDVWRREQLSLRERSLLTISVLVAGWPRAASAIQVAMDVFEENT
ncbi:carboxymuconolactone decarboxylase family protein [Paenibacillus sp. TAF58]